MDKDSLRSLSGENTCFVCKRFSLLILTLMAILLTVAIDSISLINLGYDNINDEELIENQFGYKEELYDSTASDFVSDIPINIVDPGLFSNLNNHKLMLILIGITSVIINLAGLYFIFKKCAELIYLFSIISFIISLVISASIILKFQNILNWFLVFIHILIAFLGISFGRQIKSLSVRHLRVDYGLIDQTDPEVLFAPTPSFYKKTYKVNPTLKSNSLRIKSAKQAKRPKTLPLFMKSESNL